MKNYLRLLRYLKPYKGKLIVALLAMFIFTLLQSVSIMSIVPVVDKVFRGSEIRLPPSVYTPFRPQVEQFVAKLNSIQRYPNLLNIIVIFFLICTVIKGIAEYLHQVMLEYAGQGVVRDIRNHLYGHIHMLSMDHFDKQRTGELVSRINYDVSLILESISGRFAKSLMDCIQLPFYAVIAICIQWQLALITIVVLPLLVAPIGIVGKKVRKLTRRSQEKIADISSILFETISGIRVVKAFCMERYEWKKFKNENQKLFRVMVDTVKKSAILSPLTELGGVLVMSFLLYFGARLIIKGTIDVGWFVAFLICLLAMVKPLKNLGKLNVGFQKAMSAAVRIFQLLDTKSSIIQKESADSLSRISRSVEFDHVSFEYAAEEGTVLENLCLNVRAGEIVAIVGPSGSGKTSMVNLIPRLYDPTEGSVKIDGIDIREVTLRSLRLQIGIVTQETILFNDTVRNNIAYGHKGADYESVIDAARMANAHDFIMALPSGYETNIGEKGDILSGGERQRLAIARAILKNPAILILDEATSALDTESERLVQNAIDKLMRGRTVFVIAHRLSTIQNADRVIVLHEGKIVQEGQHNELVILPGPYKRLYELQFSR